MRLAITPCSAPTATRRARLQVGIWLLMNSPMSCNRAPVPRRRLHRQSKSFGGPLDLKLDPCVYAPVVSKACAQSAVSLCEAKSGIVGCDFVCKRFGCKKPNKPNYARKGLRAAASQDFAGQCGTGTTDSADTCCPPSRLAMNPTPHCCGDGETLDPSKDTCVKVDSILPATALCPPERMTPSGKCCTPPQVSDGLKCADPAPGAPKPAPHTPLLSLGPVFTETIHFLQDHPGPGETSNAAILTSEGVGELVSVQGSRRLVPDLQARLIGKASSEGDTAYNQLLSERRVGFIKGKIPGKFGEPLLPDSETEGCRSLGVGLWSCGESKSDQKNANPDDRIVTVTFVRNTVAPAQLQPPTFDRPRALSKNEFDFRATSRQAQAKAAPRGPRRKLTLSAPPRAGQSGGAAPPLRRAAKGSSQAGSRRGVRSAGAGGRRGGGSGDAMPDPGPQVSASPAQVNRKCATCEEEDK